MQTVTTPCRDKVSPQCTGTFEKKIQRGRPQVNCVPCKDFKLKPKTSTKVRAANPINVETMERDCPCGNKFKVKPGRGRKAEKCEDCRNAGTVYRVDDDGLVQAVKADQVKAEEHARRAAAGRERALLLHLDMQKIFRRRGLVMAGN